MLLLLHLSVAHFLMEPLNGDQLHLVLYYFVRVYLRYEYN